MRSNITYILLPALLFVFLAAPSFAEEKATLNDIIKGFDEEKSSHDELRDTLKGFEGNTKDNEKGRADEDILKGFDDETGNKESDVAEKAENESRFSLDGYFKLGSSYNMAHDAPENGETDWRGLSRLRGELQLDLSVKFSGAWQALLSGKGSYDPAYEINGRDEFTHQVIDNYEKELEFREAYISGSLTDSLDIKVGRQIVVWGKSDNIRVTDVLNPLDMREPGLTDIEDLRLPVTMTRMDYYMGDWSLTGIALHEIRFNKGPYYGSDFYPFSSPPPHEDKPKSRLDNTEFAIALTGILSGWDISFYWADIYDDIPHAELISMGPPPLIEQKHSRLKMYGADFNIALGNWLLKAEAAYFYGLKFFNAEERTLSRMDVLAGIEYSGFKDMTVCIEAINRHINSFDNILKQAPDRAQKDEFQWVVRLTRNFLNETLTMTLLASTYGISGGDGAFQRFSAEYDVTDAVKITGGIVLYQSGDLARFNNIGDNDRLFLEIKYSF